MRVLWTSSLIIKYQWTFVWKAYRRDYHPKSVQVNISFTLDLTINQKNTFPKTYHLNAYNVKSEWLMKSCPFLNGRNFDWRWSHQVCSVHNFDDIHGIFISRRTFRVVVGKWLFWDRRVFSIILTRPAFFFFFAKKNEIWRIGTMSSPAKI